LSVGVVALTAAAVGVLLRLTGTQRLRLVAHSARECAGAGPTKISHFELLGELGRGTTGVVYEARDLVLNRRVALKVPVLAPESERAVRTKRFLRESRALAFLSGRPSVGIPAIHEVVEYQGQPFYSRELVDGSTLEQLVATGSIDLRTGLAVVAEIARVVHGVHERGFVHRNLSAANVLVGRDGTAWLIGFGRVGDVAGSQQMPAGAMGTSAEVDVRGLRELVRWLYGAVRQPVPAGLEHVLAPGAVPTAGALGEALARAW
jgi:serine/threonine protein kinase